MNGRLIAKRTVQGFALLLIFPLAAVSLFGRFRPLYITCAHAVALAPGPVGNLLRGAFYKLTLRNSSIDTNVGFGTYFVYPEASIASHVSIGAYCVIGRVSIGSGTQIASHVGIPGGRYQHGRDAEGRLSRTVPGMTVIGENCWVGESAVVLADVGPAATLGAGAVVVHDIPGGVLAVGNPARVVSKASA